MERTVYSAALSAATIATTTGLGNIGPLNVKSEGYENLMLEALDDNSIRLALRKLITKVEELQKRPQSENSKIRRNMVGSLAGDNLMIGRLGRGFNLLAGELAYASGLLFAVLKESLLFVTVHIILCNSLTLFRTPRCPVDSRLSAASPLVL